MDYSILILILFTLSCKACSLYLYQSIYCLSLCPSKYTISNFTCLAPSDSNYLITHIEFNNFLIFSQNSINEFQTDSQIPFNESRNNPIPTFDRGFYFGANSSLIANSPNWIIA